MSRLLKSIFGAGSDYDTHAPYKYPEFDRTPEDAPRYTPNDDGWWRRPDAEGTNEAVLCCVGSGLGMLLCAYLVSVSAYGSLSPLNLLVYMVSWLAPVWFLSGWVHRF